MKNLKKTRFVCYNCGHASLKWEGKCPDCHNWNTLIEEPIIEDREQTFYCLSQETPIAITDLDVSEEQRLSSLTELDRVLGGGFVTGSLVLVGGAPGIGKSTLLLQAASIISEKYGKVIYISGEESVSQTKIRADRLKINSPELFILHAINMDVIQKHLQTLKPVLVVIDSIQTIYDPCITAAPGSVSQVREASGRLLRIAKDIGITIVLIGHITKEGAIAGPRVMEHIVDTVLYLEGDPNQPYRLLRATKNRFGPTNEVGLWEMVSMGLVPVKNTAELFIKNRPLDTSGSVVIPIMEGNRPFLIEIQSLVSRSYFGFPRRTVVGIDLNRISIILAILEKRTGINLSQWDVFLKVTGSLKLKDPAADLGIALAITSSYYDRCIDPYTVFLGELGLAGEIKSISNIDKRLKEASSMGFKKAIIPFHCLDKNQKPQYLQTIGVERLKETIEIMKLK